MRSKLLIIVCLLAVQNVFGQYGGEEGVASRFRAGVMWYYTGLRPAQEGKARKYDRLIFDVVYNDWIGDQEPFKNHWASIGLNTSFIFDIPMNKKNTTSFGIGISHQLMRVRHDQIFYKYDTPVKTELQEPTLQDFDKNILMGNLFAVPVEFRFRNKDWKHFKFHIGGKIGYQANMYSKVVYGSGANRNLIKDYGFPDLNPLVYGAHFRIGIRNWALFGSYNFNKIFKHAESTALNQIQFGLSISLY